MIPSKPPSNQPLIQQCLRIEFHHPTYRPATDIQLIFTILKLKLKLRLRLQAPTPTHPSRIPYLLPTTNKPATLNHPSPTQAPPRYSKCAPKQSPNPSAPTARSFSSKSPPKSAAPKSSKRKPTPSHAAPRRRPKQGNTRGSAQRVSKRRGRRGGRGQRRMDGGWGRGQVSPVLFGQREDLDCVCCSCEHTWLTSTCVAYLYLVSAALLLSPLITGRGIRCQLCPSVWQLGGRSR